MTGEVPLLRGLAIVALLLASGCTAAQPTVSPSPVVAGQPSPSVPASPAATAPATTHTPMPLTFRNSAPQARMVATLVAFLDAFNAGRVDAALALLTEDVVTSDCHYRGVRVTTADGTEAARRWLAERAVDHDRLVLESIANENPDATTGSHVVAVSYSRRTSDTLRGLGFPNGVAPRLLSKVIFTATGDRIRAFANGPFGGDQQLCRPSS